MRHQSTEKASLGNQFEDFVASHYKKKRYKIIARNVFINSFEVDLIVQPPHSDAWILIEVRGRTEHKDRPSLYLSHEKIRKLKVMARILEVRFKRRVGIELVECIGDFSVNSRLALKIKNYSIFND